MAKRARTRPEFRPSPADFPPLSPATSQGPALGEAALTWRNRVAALGVERRAREIAFLDRAISDRNQQFRRLKEGVAELEQTLQDRISLSKDVPGLRAQRAELRRDLESLRRQRQDLAAAPAELIQAKAELDRVRHDLVLTRHEFAELERIRAEHESAVIELRERAATHQSAVGSSLEELEKLNRHIERARRERETAAAEERTQREALEKTRAEWTCAQAALTVLQRQIDAAHEVFEGLSRQRMDLETAITTLTETRQRMDDEASEEERVRRNRQANLARLDDELLALHLALTAARNAEQTEREQFARAKSERNEVIDQLDGEICGLLQQKSAAERALKTSSDSGQTESAFRLATAATRQQAHRMSQEKATGSLATGRPK